MNFDSKTYLYYTAMNELYDAYDSKKEKLAEKLIEILGDIEIKPGQLKIDEKGKYGKSIYADYVRAENLDLYMWKFQTNILCDIEAIGTFGNNVITRIYTSFNCTNDNSNLDLSIADPQKGIYFFTTRMYCYESSGRWEPCYVYYDKDVIRTLKEDYGLKDSEVAAVTPAKLYTMGILPDKFGFFKIQELGYSNATEMAQDIFAKVSCKELEEKFDNIDVNTEKNAKHLAKSKEYRKMFNI